MASPAKILIVDDEANIRASLAEMLARDGYRIVMAESGERAIALIGGESFDLALIDLKLSGKLGGIDVLKALRQRSPDTVAIVLTAHASLETAVEALRQDAHDYLFKPCKPAELRESVQKGLLERQARQNTDLIRQIDRVAGNLEEIRATLLAQKESYTAPLPSPRAMGAATTPRPPRFLRCAGLIVDLLRHIVTADGHLLDLSPTEFDYLVYLIEKSPQVISPQELLREVHGYESEPWEASETVRQHVYRIRQKIKEATGRDDIIQTVRGIGYAIADAP